MNKHIPPFTDDEMDIVRQTDLPDLFTSLGYQVKSKGSYHTLAEMPHIMIKRRTGYYDNYERTWGDAITFLQVHHGMDFKQSVTHLLKHNGCNHAQSEFAKPRSLIPSKEEKPPTEFKLPEAHTNHRRVFAYLIKRGISRDVITDFIRNGLLYESAEYHNAVFVGMNAEGKPVNAYMRGTYDRVAASCARPLPPKGERLPHSTASPSPHESTPSATTFAGTPSGFKGDVPAGDKNNAFRLPADPANDIVFCFESPIDLMAYSTLHGEPKTNAVALCCLHDGTLEQYLKENPHIKHITFCLDNDKWGQEANERLSAKYNERGYTISALCPPKGKDWAEYAAKKKMYQSKGR
ncbi:DUF3991 and toprim domain-containing protein [Christensenella minuta]|uniref:DUF3991 and toprim domain-containing protein n=1 Tax=Christensenella minuta TaxID=626937 RepID=UPI00215739D0|nr:DUF3991 and toprim domain-containing protein [Christensenella minuta]